MSASSAGASCASRSRLAISSPQSGILDSCELSDGAHEVHPLASMAAQEALARRHDPVIAPPPLRRFFYPSPFDEAVVLQTVEQGIQRRGVHAQETIRSLLEELAQLIPVARLRLEQGEDEERGRALLELVREHGAQCVCPPYIAVPAVASQANGEEPSGGWGLARDALSY